MYAARSFEQATYDQALEELSARYPTTEALLATAIARMSGGE